MTIPYQSATPGTAARVEMIRIPRRFSCESVGFMDDFEKHELLLVFKHRGPLHPAARFHEGLGADASEAVDAPAPWLSCRS
jgi:hypothetical protein